MSASRKPRATLNQVAAKAGVSPTTASLILGGKAGKHRISEETYLRVRQAAADLDYVPNLLVHSMQRGATHILSFFNGFRHREVHDLYMDSLSTAVERAAGRLGYDILVNCDFSRSPEETYRHLNGGVVDGVLFFSPPGNDPLLSYLRASRLPTVLLGQEDVEGILPSVKDDMESGMRQVAEQLVSLGHRRIAALCDLPGGNPDSRARIELLQALLYAKEVSLPDRWILPARGTLAGSHETALRFLLSEPEPPTALFCWHDHAAYKMLECCEALGVLVPEQLSILGYDGLPWPAATPHTAASVRVDIEVLAEEAIQLLVQQVQGHNLGITQKRIPVTLTYGTTLAPPKDA
jgi:LacI family transcriptional regulator